MMIETITPSQFYAAIIVRLGELFGSKIRHIGSRVAHDGDNQLITPALVVEIEPLRMGDDLMDERLPLDFTVNIYCMMGYATHKPEENIHVEREIVNMATHVLAGIRRERWGLTCSTAPLRNLEAMPADSKPDADGYEEWVISFDQTIYSGNSIWEQGEEFLPTKVNLGVAPDIGQGKQGEYETLA